MIDGIVSIIVTVISGVLVFIIGQILTSIWLTPLQQYKELKKEVVYKLSYYANLYSNAIVLADYSDSDKFVEEFKLASDELRKLSCSLKGFAETISWFRIGIPNQKTINDSADLIMKLSNSFFTPYNTGESYEQNRKNYYIANEIFNKLKCYYKK
jgi:hypothetical protein